MVIVNTVEVETTEDVLEADQEEDGGGGGVDRAGDSRVHRPDPGEGSHDTQLESLSEEEMTGLETISHLRGEAGLGQLVVQPGQPGHQSDRRSDEGGSVTSENSGEEREEDTARVLGLDHGHPPHDLPHPLHLLDTPEEAEHKRLGHKLEDTILRSGVVQLVEISE